MKHLIFALLLIAPAAFAQDIDDAQILERLRDCYGTTDDLVERQGCMFTITDACQTEVEGGYSTLGIFMCNQAEVQAWDVLLNEEYKATMKFSRTADLGDAEYTPNLGKRADTLRAAQRVWIEYRDAECLNEYAQWGSGSHRIIAGTACQLRMTAERTIELWQKRAFFE